MSTSVATSTMTGGTKATGTDTYNYIEQAPKAPIPENADDATTPPAIQGQRSADLDPGVVHQDRLRQNEIQTSIRHTFSSLITSTVKNPGHKTVENFIVGMVRPNPEPQKYAQYLYNLCQDLTIVEVLLQKENLPMSTLPRLYFTSKIAQDLEYFKFAGGPSPQMVQYKHEAHFNSLAGKPHLLMGHFSIHALGLLAGGKILTKIINPVWGDRASNLYKFPDDDALKTDFKKELDEYMTTLSEPHYQELVAELQHIWEYVGDMTGNDIRIGNREKG
jgi:heme oxygenase